MTRMTENEVRLLEQATEIVNAQLEKIEKPILKGIDWGKTLSSSDVIKAFTDIKLKHDAIWFDELSDSKFDYSAFLYNYKKEVYKQYDKYLTGQWEEAVFKAERHNLTSKQIFLEAYNLIKDEKNWCQKALKKETEQNYYEIEPLQTEAYNETTCSTQIKMPKIVRKLHTQYCSIGAVLKADRLNFSKSSVHGTISKAASAVATALTKAAGGIEKFNDTHSHKEVVAVWEKVGKAEGWL